MKNTQTNFKLLLINFLEFFAFGAWLLSAGAYMGTTLGFTGIQIGSVYATSGIASLIMPTLVGVVADRWLPYKVVFSICHFIVAALFLALTLVSDYATFYALMLGVSLFFMPTVPLNSSISFAFLTQNKQDVVKAFPPIRVLGTIGFILAAWCIDLFGWKLGKEQFILSAVASIAVALFSLLALPGKSFGKAESKTPDVRIMDGVMELLKKRNVTIFLIFSILLGSILQVTNTWGVPFLDDFKLTYPDSFVVKHPVIILSISQISEVVFILTIPFIYKKFGIKILTLIGMLAWVFRFGLFSVSAPEGVGLVCLISSMIVYGMAFDFFNISGSLFVERESDPRNRGVAQGLFFFTTGGLGALLGGYLSGGIVDFFTNDGLREWTSIWTIFTIYAAVIALFFALLFRNSSETNKEVADNH